MYNKEEVKPVKQKSYAKINLTLDVTGTRPDGYHQLCMVMHSVSLYDTVTLTLTNTGTIELKTNLPYLPTDRKNHAWRAAELFYQKTGITGKGLLIEIEKKIPVCAGLAGGSANAAAVLKGMNKLYHGELSMQELCEIGCQIGADVPYCIRGGTMLAEGIGEQLSPLPALPAVPVVLAKPSFGISTPEVFRQWDKAQRPCHPDTQGMIAALSQKNINAVSQLLCNALEESAFEVMRSQGRPNIVAELKDCMLRMGAMGVLMSGSGPTVYGFFPSRKKAVQAAKELRKKVAAVFIAST